ncbi:hypothetical protein FOC30_28685 [Burkholderia multivorans]|nr:hypothetical protein FOC30_28685 [Burkholderia multivorans]
MAGEDRQDPGRDCLSATTRKAGQTLSGLFHSGLHSRVSRIVSCGPCAVDSHYGRQADRTRLRRLAFRVPAIIVRFLKRY